MLRAPVDSLSNETDHLEGSTEIYIPDFCLTYNANILSKIEQAQKDDEIVVKIVKKVRNLSMATINSGVSLKEKYTLIDEKDICEAQRQEICNVKAQRQEIKKAQRHNISLAGPSSDVAGQLMNKSLAGPSLDVAGQLVNESLPGPSKKGSTPTYNENKGSTPIYIEKKGHTPKNNNLKGPTPSNVENKGSTPSYKN